MNRAYPAVTTCDPGAQWRQRPEYGEALEQEIEDAIRGVLEKYAIRE